MPRIHCPFRIRRHLTRRSCNSQIPPDFVVKSQAIDIMDVIRSRIRRQNFVQTLSSNRLSRYKPLSASEASWFTTKSVGVWQITPGAGAESLRGDRAPGVAD